MFGYVTPYKMELKIKDYEKIKGYYCGLCKVLKDNYGNIIRISLNYDVVFMAIFLDAFNKDEPQYIKNNCILHPIKKRIFIINNDTLNYAASINIALTYYKILDDIKDENSFRGKSLSPILKRCLKKIPNKYQNVENMIANKLNELYDAESKSNSSNLDELSHPFGELTALLLTSYVDKKDNYEKIYNLGYNLGRWIYIIDAFDDLEKDIKENKFNAINSVMNRENLPYSQLEGKIKDRINFVLTSYGRECAETLDTLPLYKNQDILYNIFTFGLLEKMDRVFLKKKNNKTS